MAESRKQQNRENRENQSETRIPVLTIAMEHVRAYITLFLILTISGIGFTIWYETVIRTRDTIADSVHSSMVHVDDIGMGAVIISAVAAELRRYRVVLGGIIEYQLKMRRQQERDAAREEGRAKGRAEGREEGRAETEEALAAALEELESLKKSRETAPTATIATAETVPATTIEDIRNDLRAEIRNEIRGLRAEVRAEAWRAWNTPAAKLPKPMAVPSTKPRQSKPISMAARIDRSTASAAVRYISRN